MVEGKDQGQLNLKNMVQGSGIVTQWQNLHVRGPEFNYSSTGGRFPSLLYREQHQSITSCGTPKTNKAPQNLNSHHQNKFLLVQLSTLLCGIGVGCIHSQCVVWRLLATLTENTMGKIKTKTQPRIYEQNTKVKIVCGFYFLYRLNREN